MKKFSAVTATSFAVLLAAASRGAPSTGTPFTGDPPNATHPWAVHDQNHPQPKRVEPGTVSTPAQPGTPPSDAIVLFDGTAESLTSNWEADTAAGGPTKWVVNDGAMECAPRSGYTRTKQQFGDCQLHLEWAAPKNVKGDSQGRGNSGVYLMALCEVQLLDDYNNPTYADGFAGSVYGVMPPLANALRPPGEFQTIDIVFRRPIYRDGQPVDPGYLTVFWNGVLVQDHTPIEGPTGATTIMPNHLQRPTPHSFGEQGPLRLQDHGNPVRFRNIWLRPLPPRKVEGGTDGALDVATTAAKRKEIAAGVRADAANLTGTAQLLRLAESLCYESDAATVAQVGQMTSAYVDSLKSLSGAALDAKRSEAKSVQGAFQYLAKWQLVPAGFAPKAALDAFAKSAGWDTEKK